MRRPELGAHVSAAGKLTNAIINAESIGAECIQIFGASPQAWATRQPSEENVKAFKEAHAKSKVGAVFLHGAYLVNLTSPDPAQRQKSEVNLAEHLKIASSIGAKGLIFHVGSGKEMEKSAAIKIVIASMKRVLSHVKSETWLVIENSAGGGQKIGSSASEIGLILSGLNSSRVKVCWDSAHAFEAGVIETYNEVNVKKLARDLDSGFGIENLVAMHINDSKTVFNSKHDRHENLGQGYIGLSGFKALARETAFYKAAWILEVPGFEGEGPDKKNVDILKSCFLNK